VKKKNNFCTPEGVCGEAGSFIRNSLKKCIYFKPHSSDDEDCVFRIEAMFDESQNIYDWYDNCENPEALLAAKMEEI